MAREFSRFPRFFVPPMALHRHFETCCRRPTMVADTRTPSDVRGPAWYARVTLNDVEAVDGSSETCRVLGIPVARITYRDLRAICARLAVPGYKNKRKADMVRMIADMKLAVAVHPSEREAAGRDPPRRIATPAGTASQVCGKYPRVTVATPAQSFLERADRNSDGDSHRNPVAALCRRPLRLALPRVASSPPHVCAASMQFHRLSSHQCVDFDCQLSAESPQAARRLDVCDERCSTSGSSSAASDDIRFVTPSSQDSSSPSQEHSTPSRARVRARSDKSASLATWFKVSDRISALRASLKAEGDRAIAGELHDDIAFLVRKKRQITRLL